MKFYNGYINNLKENQVFVFGSNPEGRHGAGTAKIARIKFGAEYGNGRGIQGQSYALPTKNLKTGFYEKETGIKYLKDGYKSISEEQIIDNITMLYYYVDENKDKEFLIAYQNEGFNLNGYTSEEMLDMFLLAGEIPANIVLSNTYKELYLNKIKNINVVYKNYIDRLENKLFEKEKDDLKENLLIPSNEFKDLNKRYLEFKEKYNNILDISLAKEDNGFPLETFKKSINNNIDFEL
jgi:hypothetical protein